MQIKPILIILDCFGGQILDLLTNSIVSWNLANISGRNVANGTHLIIAEAKGAKGTYAYSAKVGIKR